MKLRLTIDRFEGDNKPVAVFLTDGSDQIHFPNAMLPRGVKAGDTLTLAIEKDTEATKLLALETRTVQDQLKKPDPGGDIKL